MRILSAAPWRLFFACLGQAHAGKQDFTLINRTGYPIDSVFVSKSSASTWEDDVMGKDTLEADGSVDISFEKGDRGCHYRATLRRRYRGGSVPRPAA